MIRNSFFTIALFAIVSCHNNAANTPPAAAKDTMKMNMAADSTHKANLKNLAFDYVKDPACGMPLKVGLEDTTTYQGKLYGFCSKECKEAFLKEPKTYLAQIKKAGKDSATKN